MRYEEDAASTRDQSLKLLAKAEADAEEIRQDAKELRVEASQRVRDSKEKAEAIKNEARNEAEKVISFAEAQAKEIAGDAYEAKAKADSYDKAIRAMRNTIEGYKDDYIIPNHSVLDDLADEFGHKEAGEELKATRKRVREMVKDGYAGACDYVEAHRKTYAIHFAVDAFNGKVDSALSKVKHDNYGKIKQEIIDAFALVNHNGAPFRNARINQEYLDTRLTELKWAVVLLNSKKSKEKNKPKSKHKFEKKSELFEKWKKLVKKQRKKNACFKKRLRKLALNLQPRMMSKELNMNHNLLNSKANLKKQKRKYQRALSMAQQTRRGHVYVISNIGSFGEEVFKIGMTRRLEPMDRVKELGDASVPFSFDVHAMIYSEDAPALEKNFTEDLIWTL